MIRYNKRRWQIQEQACVFTKDIQQVWVVTVVYSGPFWKPYFPLKSILLCEKNGESSLWKYFQLS